jgi:hypothetical protein
VATYDRTLSNARGARVRLAITETFIEPSREDTMHAVLTEVDVTGVERDAGIQALEERIVPGVKQIEGFTSGIWLTGNQHGTGLSLMLFEDEQTADAAAKLFPVGTNPETGVTITRCEVREVAVTA